MWFDIIVAVIFIALFYWILFEGNMGLCIFIVLLLFAIDKDSNGQFPVISWIKHGIEVLTS